MCLAFCYYIKHVGDGMIYRIKEGLDNDIKFYDITVKDFSYLMNEDYDIIIKEMIMKSQLLRIINLPDVIMELVVDTIINNKDVGYLKKELTRNRVPLYSLVINLVNTHRAKYIKLLELQDAVQLEIECTKENFIKGLELARKINKKVIINGKTITLSEYYELLSNCDIDLFVNLDIKVNYQDQNSNIGIRELYETAFMISNIVDDIKKYNLSPLEKIIYIYDRVKSRIYKESDENKLESRDLDKVLKNKTIVCVGFSNLFNALSKCLGFNAMSLVSIQRKHQRSLVYVRDDKYNIDGVYVFDPTNDSRRNDNYIDNYAYFGLTLEKSEMDHPTATCKYISQSFDEIVRIMDRGDDDFTESIDMINNLKILFELINEKSYKEFIDIISNYDYVITSQKKRALDIYRNLVNKYNSRELSVNKFMLAVYNTRVIEYYCGLIDDFDIEDIKEASRIRMFFQKLNYLECKKTVANLLDVMNSELEVYDILDQTVLNNKIDEERDKLRVRLLKVLRNRIK